MEKKEFVGTWKLVSTGMRMSDEETEQELYGDDAFGYLIYSEDGYMAAQMSNMKPSNLFVKLGMISSYNKLTSNLSPGNLKRFLDSASNLLFNLVLPVVKPRLISSSGFDKLAYSGKYGIIGNKVIHYVDVSSHPNVLSGDEERFFEFTGDRLTLSTEIPGYGEEKAIGRLTWERVAENK